MNAAPILTYNRLIDVTWTENRADLNIEKCIFLIGFTKKAPVSLWVMAGSCNERLDIQSTN